LDEIGKRRTAFFLENGVLSEIGMALRGVNGRKMLKESQS